MRCVTKLATMMLLIVLCTVGFAEAVDFRLQAQPISCVTSTFAKSGNANWYSVSLTIKNSCSVNLDFTNTVITFNNAEYLNTNFWGSFAPLSYPDSVLRITSTAQSGGGYLVSLPFHLPEAAWSNRILKPNETFTIFYGTPYASYDANSVKVYAQPVTPPQPPLVGNLLLANSTAKPALIAQDHVVVNIVLNSQNVAVAQVPWSSQITVPDLTPNTYTLVPVQLDDMQANTYVGSAAPSTITIVANQTVQSTISYTAVPYNGGIKISTPPLPPELSGYTNPVSVTLTRQDNGVVTTKILPWQQTTTITGLRAGVTYRLSTDAIAYNNKRCSGTFSPQAVAASATPQTISNLTYTCSAMTGGKIMAYMPGWKTPPLASSIAAAGYTDVLVAFGVFSTTNPGQIVNAFDTVTKNYIAELHQAGLRVLLSLGGASTSIPNTSVDFHQVLSLASSTTAFQNAFVSSVQNFVTNFGFDGIDIDIEHGLVGTGSFSSPTGDIAALAAIINTLHQQNPSLLISLTPQVANISATSAFDGTWGNYASLIMQTSSALSHVGIQIYNTGCAFGIDHVCYSDDATNPDLSVAMATALLEDWPQQDESGRPTGFQPYKSFVNPQQLALGYPAPNRQGVSDGQPAKSTSVIKRAVKCLRTAQRGADSCNTYVPPRAYPNFGSVFEWEITYDQDNNFRFATDLTSCVLGGNC